MSAFALARYRSALLLIAVLTIGWLIGPRSLRGAAPSKSAVYLPLVRAAQLGGGLPIVFVSRQIPANGSIYWDVPKDMPGVGPHSRFEVAAPGKLIIREPGGQLRVLVDGSAPAPASLSLIDVNAPDVAYDGKTIVFAGLPAGGYKLGAQANGSWRIYAIGVDGTGLRQITFSDQSLNMTQFGPAGAGLTDYADTDPAWLPDGRIVLSSTRWPSYAQYSGARTSNLYIVNADGSALHRITSERNGADRPLVDPLTGKIVYARWWRNHRFALNDMATVPDGNGGYLQKDGLSSDRTKQIDDSGTYADWLWRNAWQAATINPDGTGLAMWGGTMRDEEANHVYGGTFTPGGDLIANFFPMYNMVEAGGFGGLRRYHRGPGTYTPILGITNLKGTYAHPTAPTSFGIFKGAYAADPDVLPDDQLVISWAPDVNQDYGLYIVNTNGSGLTKLYDNPGTSELRARVVRARPLPPIVADTITQVPNLLPPTAAGPYNGDGTFTFDALNVYANAPVDADIVSAPPVGSATTLRFFIDQQRSSTGSFPAQDWPILLGEKAVSPAGAIVESQAPANVPLFEQLRSTDGTVPLTGGPIPNGAAHVAGLNYGRPGAVVRCVGCHAGHTMIAVPLDPNQALFSNLAPGAQVSVSSSRDPNYNIGLIDRRVLKGEIWRYWTSAQDQTSGQWVKLTFPVPVTVRLVRLYNPRQGDQANSSLHVNAATVKLYSDAAGTAEVASKTAGALSVAGTDVSFADLQARVVLVQIDSVSGTFYGMRVASLAEIEVIARGEAGP